MESATIASGRGIRISHKAACSFGTHAGLNWTGTETVPEPAGGTPPLHAGSWEAHKDTKSSTDRMKSAITIEVAANDCLICNDGA